MRSGIRAFPTGCGAKTERSTATARDADLRRVSNFDGSWATPTAWAIAALAEFHFGTFAIDPEIAYGQLRWSGESWFGLGTCFRTTRRAGWAARCSTGIRSRISTSTSSCSTSPPTWRSPASGPETSAPASFARRATLGRGTTAVSNAVSKSPATSDRIADHTILAPERKLRGFLSSPLPARGEGRIPLHRASMTTKACASGSRR